MVRMVAMDVDGTLVDSQYKLTDKVRLSLQEVSASGIELVIVSGRNREGVQNFLKYLGLDLSYISSNGALLYCHKLNKVLASYPMPREIAHLVMKTAMEMDIGIFLEMPDRLYWWGKDEYLNLLLQHGKLNLIRMEDPISVTSTDPMKITLVKHHAGLLEMDAYLKKLELPISFSFSQDHFLELTQVGVTKGKALREFAEKLDIPLNEVMAIGDGGNDISMFEVAGTSIAMGNAHDYVKQAADLVAPTNDEDGVVWALTKMELMI